MTDYKALCARMADELDHYRQLLMDDRRETHALATEARAALARPEMEKAVNWAAYFARQAAAQEKELQDALAQPEPESPGLSNFTRDMVSESTARRARAALAQPEPEGPSKAELRQIFDDQSGFINDEQVMWWSDFQPAARAVLARWGNL
jgi:hypothetical protein